MNKELLNAAKEFDDHFIDTFPNVTKPAKQISDFNLALNEFAQQSTEHRETIHFITVLLSNSDLEAFAAKDSQDARRTGYEQTADHRGQDDELSKLETQASIDDQDIITAARAVVDGSHNEAGLKELVSKLIDDLETEA
ncbi:hypothetical protein [Spirosoma sp.]|uniref:hypothetical protein n=1 Tax=Spirosoma sp. TaxID=1899569 RepID=UPI003B3A0F26